MGKVKQFLNQFRSGLLFMVCFCITAIIIRYSMDIVVETMNTRGQFPGLMLLSVMGATLYGLLFSIWY